MKILIVFGTRPEAIKMAPLCLELGRHPGLETRVCVTGQHRQMLDQVLDVFGLKPDFDLNLMRSGQDLTDITSSVLQGMRSVFARWRPDWVLVHGDTTTTLAASLAAYYARIRVAHVEAGLRTYDRYAPWPEEINRRATATIASQHFAPTPRAEANLVAEGVPREDILVTGNTVIDALLDATRRIQDDPRLMAQLDAQLSFLDPSRKLILVTAHRRENFGARFLDILRAVRVLGERADVEVVFPVHLNPQVRDPAFEVLSGAKGVHLVQPMNYLPFVYLMNRCHLVLSDSGGIQEEAPSLGKPVLVLRDATERPEAVESGTAILVGSDGTTIVREATRLLDEPVAYAQMANLKNPYGDGLASQRIAQRLVALANARRT